MATATLNKWGNSQGVIIPKKFCEELHMGIGDTVEMELCENGIRIKPERSYTLEALMAGYDGPKPQEYDWGKPLGREMW